MSEMKIVSSKTAYTARYFKVVQNTIERNGKTFTKDFIEKNDVVMVIPYTNTNEIYMELQFRDALEKTALEIVAGQIETGDEPFETAKKELQEETGLSAKTWHKLAVWDLSVNMKSKIYLYAATDLTQGESALEDDEEIEVIKLPLETLMEKVRNGEVTASAHVAALFLFNEMRQEGKL